MEYSGYVDRATVTAAPTVNWGGILTNLNKNLDANEAAREATRQKQATDTQKALEEINAMNVGQNQTGNEYITKASYQAKTLLNDAYKKYTSGQMTREQFNIIKQNTSSSFSDVNTYMKTLQDNYLKYQEMSQKGELSKYSDYMQAELGKLADLSNKTMYFNPPDGKGYIAVIDKDGKIDTKNTLETSWIKGGTNFFDPKVKVEDEVGKFTGKMKEFTRMMNARRGYGLWTVEDPTARPEFDKLSKDISSAVASTPLRMASVLTDFVTDKNYTYTKDENEAAADPSKILLVKTSSGVLQPKLTDQQIADGEAAIKRVIKSQLGYKETQVEETYRPREFAPKDGKKEEPIPTTNDIVFSSSLKRGGKYIPAQRFISNVPVVDPSTGTKKTIKSIIIDPTNGEVEMDIETSGESISGAPTVRTISSKKNGISGKGAKVRMDEMNNMVRFIYSNKRGRYLENYKELVEEKIGETQAIADRNKRGSTSNMVNVQLSNGQVGSIPANQLSAFLKDNPGSKKI
jgi:hypothetical protein